MSAHLDNLMVRYVSPTDPAFNPSLHLLFLTMQITENRSREQYLIRRPFVREDRKKTVDKAMETVKVSRDRVVYAMEQTVYQRFTDPTSYASPVSNRMPPGCTGVRLVPLTPEEEEHWSDKYTDPDTEEEITLPPILIKNKDNGGLYWDLRLLEEMSTNLSLVLREDLLDPYASNADILERAEFSNWVCTSHTMRAVGGDSALTSFGAWEAVWNLSSFSKPLLDEKLSQDSAITDEAYAKSTQVTPTPVGDTK